MDTKLKRYSILFKILSFMLVVVSSCFIMLTLNNLKAHINEVDIDAIENLTANHYTETWQYASANYQLESAMRIILQYKSEQNILDGNEISQSDIDGAIQSLFYDNQYIIEENLYNSGATDITQKMLWDRFQQDFKTEIENIKDVLIQNQLTDFRNAIYEFEHTPNLYYYLNSDGNIISNKDFKLVADSKYSYDQTYYASDNKTVISQGAFAFDEKYINDLNTQLLAAKDGVDVCIMQGSLWLFLFLLGIAYLIFAAGKKAVSPQGVHHIFIDKIYNEIISGSLFLSVCAIILCGVGILEEVSNQMFMLLLLVLSVFLAVAFILALVRHIKSRTLLKHTIIFSVFHYLFKSVKKIFDAGSPMVKACLIIVGLGLLTAIPFMFIVTLPLALIFTYMQIKKYIVLKNAVEQIKNGSYNQKINIIGNGEIATLAANINDISSGIGTEVERRLKSERLKTELIVNVSHDIRTPLTSVITYVDLLKKENIENRDAKKYIDVIANKSDRLKQLIDDLFDASKAASGNIHVNYEEVDVNELITQGLGELGDKIKSSSLDFKINLPEEKITAYADGRLTWRVLENLLSNVFKYSLAGSRVYIDVFEDEQNAYVEIKNISATELNIPEDEIMERFKRGDESRNSEGSGLGLDIAKSLMLCQNGELIIRVDGDLFKAKLKIPKIR